MSRRGTKGTSKPISMFRGRAGSIPLASLLEFSCVNLLDLLNCSSRRRQKGRTLNLGHTFYICSPFLPPLLLDLTSSYSGHPIKLLTSNHPMTPPISLSSPWLTRFNTKFVLLNFKITLLHLPCYS